jgi:hypothetical protein
MFWPCLLEFSIQHDRLISDDDRADPLGKLARFREGGPGLDDVGVKDGRVDDQEIVHESFLTPLFVSGWLLFSCLSAQAASVVPAAWAM